MNVDQAIKHKKILIRPYTFRWMLVGLEIFPYPSMKLKISYTCPRILPRPLT